jgi:hypothetical protein
VTDFVSQDAIATAMVSANTSVFFPHITAGLYHFFARVYSGRLSVVAPYFVLTREGARAYSRNDLGRQYRSRRSFQATLGDRAG